MPRIRLHDLLWYDGRVKKKVILIAHRGDPAHAPENTLVSVRQAVEKGAVFVEIDLRRTKDGVWVALHDPTLKRTVGLKRRIKTMTWDEIRRLEAGGWFSPRFLGERIPRLEQVWDFCRDRGVGLFLDVKADQGQEELVRFFQRERGNRPLYAGFSVVRALKRWRQSDQGRHPLFWVTGYSAAVTKRRLWTARRLGIDGLVVYRKWINPRSVKRIHAKGLKAYAWTARTARQIEQLAACGVDGIMSEVWPHRFETGS
ncbi:MAG: hypothetical protein NC910_03270 [Candidatus Omnitrophica bacterium]|nr:hypothetical protein [Candidatus Omnitrophota bacterium]